jgi:hypothetical protein
MLIEIKEEGAKVYYSISGFFRSKDLLMKQKKMIFF